MAKRKDNDPFNGSCRGITQHKIDELIVDDHGVDALPQRTSEPPSKPFHPRATAEEDIDGQLSFARDIPAVLQPDRD